GDVGLVAAPAGDLAVARDAGLQREQADDVARVERQLDDALILEGVPQTGVGRIDRRFVGGGDCQSLRDRADLELDVDLSWSVYQGHDIGDRYFFKVEGLDVHTIRAGRERGKRVYALAGGGLRAAEILFHAADLDRGARNSLALLICDRPAHNRGAGLRQRS